MFTPLVNWIADLPEQQMIAGTSRNVSPVCMAKSENLQDNVEIPWCYYMHTLFAIPNIAHNV